MTQIYSLYNKKKIRIFIFSIKIFHILSFLFGSFSWQSFTGLFFLRCKILILLLTLLYVVWFWFFYRYFNKSPRQNHSIYPKCVLASCTRSRNDKTLIILNWPSCIKHFEGEKHITFHNVTVRLLQYVNEEMKGCRDEKIQSLFDKIHTGRAGCWQFNTGQETQGRTHYTY